MAFSIAQLRRIEGLHRDHLRLGRVHLRDLVERHLRAVVVDAHGVEHVNRGAPGAGGGHFAAEVFHRFVHARLELLRKLFQGRMSHLSAP
jgi:hypothetical protein